MSQDPSILQIPGSNRNAVASAKHVSASDPKERIQLSIYARRNPHPPANLLAGVDKPTTALPGERHYLSDADFTTVYGASKEDLDAIASWAAENHLTVISQDVASKRTEVEGTIGDMGPSGISPIRCRTLRFPRRRRAIGAKPCIQCMACTPATTGRSRPGPCWMRSWDRICWDTWG